MAALWKSCWWLVSIVASVLLISPTNGVPDNGVEQNKSVDDTDIETYTTKLIEKLISNGYNKNVRPNYGEPVDVNVSILINDINTISEAEMEFKVDFYIRHFWKDHRLSYPVRHNISQITLADEFIKKIWIPDSFFINGKTLTFHISLTSQSTTLLRIKSDGSILYSTRVSLVAQCPMDLTFFPMDQQLCSIQIGSYGYSTNEIIYHWAPQFAVEISSNIFLPTFKLLGYHNYEAFDLLSTGNYTKLECNIYLARSIGYYISQVYIPAFLIVIISWVPFWLDRDDHHARVALGVTTVLTMTTLTTNTNQEFPKISHLKAIDVYLFTSFLMVFLSLIEYATVGYYEYKLNTRPVCSPGDSPTAKSKWTQKSHRNHLTKRPKRFSQNRCAGHNNSNCGVSNVLKRRNNFRYDAADSRDIDLVNVYRIDMRSGGGGGGQKPITDHNNNSINLANCDPNSYSKEINADNGNLGKNLSTETELTRENYNSRFIIKDASVIDKWARWIFPLTFFLFNIIYSVSMWILVSLHYNSNPNLKR